jgi:hypothetical protein
MRFARPFLLLAVIFVIAACQSNPPARKEAGPEIVSSLRSGGKGVPNGRTDSPLPYLRGIKLTNASDPGYGYAADKPIRTGPYAQRLHLYYLNSLRGPNGEVVEYERRGACCAFEDASLPFGGGLLDVYDLKIEGSDKPVTLFVDMYHRGPPMLPVGFTARE